ncbi:hypothetical protein CDAR_513451 [Caerostris darwini]|uniref:Uncharacterized protein n=1 Tax=Caerostris darwini TaxID=1538125 RepID=A0AAV4WTY3_9ARAC|nr:hypothetical protein CDAR_513451 [Caerostris darwini]
MSRRRNQSFPRHSLNIFLGRVIRPTDRKVGVLVVTIFCHEITSEDHTNLQEEKDVFMGAETAQIVLNFKSAFKLAPDSIVSDKSRSLGVLFSFANSLACLMTTNQREDRPWSCSVDKSHLSEVLIPSGACRSLNSPTTTDIPSLLFIFSTHSRETHLPPSRRSLLFQVVSSFFSWRAVK